jgi:hypothetical protein
MISYQGLIRTIPSFIPGVNEVINISILALLKKPKSFGFGG